MLKLLIPFIVLAAIIGLTVATDKPQPRADFTFINRGDVTTLDLQRMSWMQDLRVARLLFEGLVAQDVFTRGYDIIPAVAERWTIDLVPDPEFPDRLNEVYTFHLRANARWSNGEPVTAGDFVYSWRRALLPDTAADYSGLFWLIKGGKEFYDWRVEANKALDERMKIEKMTDEEKADASRALWALTEQTFDEMVALHAIDDRTLTVTLNNPTPYFLDLCAFAVFFPVYPPLVERFEKMDLTSGRLRSDPGWTKPGQIVTNGPFELTLWRFKRDMRFVKSKHYWNKDTIALDTIAIQSVEDGNAQVLAFESGAVDWVSDVSPDYRVQMLRDKQALYDENAEQVARLRELGFDQFEIDRRLPDDPRKNIHAILAFGTYWYNFNCLETLPDGRPNPFSDARVRRAFAMAIDKRAITEDVQRIGNPVARTLIPPDSVVGYTSPTGLHCVSDATTDEGRRAIIDEARALLAEAGYADTSQFPTVELLFNKDGGHDLIAQALGKQWQEFLGVPVRLVQKEVKVYKDDLKKANYMTSRAGWYGDYGDPTTFLELNRTGDGNNDRKYSNPVFDDLLDQAKLETDPVARMALLTEAERIVMEDDLPMVPLFRYVTLYLFDPDELSGINGHPRTAQNLFLIDMLKDGKGPDHSRMMRDHADQSPFSPDPDAPGS